MQFSELVLHESYRNISAKPHTPISIRRPYLNFFNVGIKESQQKDKRIQTIQERKKSIISQKKQIQPYKKSNRNSHQKQNRNELVKKTQQFFSLLKQQKISHEPNSKKKQETHRISSSQGKKYKIKHNILKGNVLSMPAGTKTRNQDLYSDFKPEEQLSEQYKNSKAFNHKMKQYLSAAIHRTMLIKKTETKNVGFQPKQYLSVKLDREAMTHSLNDSKISKRVKNRSLMHQQNKRRYGNEVIGSRRSSTSHQNGRNAVNRQRKSSELLQPW